MIKNILYIIFTFKYFQERIYLTIITIDTNVDGQTEIKSYDYEKQLDVTRHPNAADAAKKMICDLQCLRDPSGSSSS